VRPPGLFALSLFFALGAVFAAATALALLTPGGALEAMWQLNPQAHAAFLTMGPWAIVLMMTVAAACASASRGLWIRARWGHRLAVTLLVVNLIADAANALLRGDLRMLVGLPIGALLIAYLLSARVRESFEGPP